MAELKQAVRDYLKAIAAVRQVGTPELSHYTALDNLFDAVGAQLKPRVRAIVHPSEPGSDQPDIGFFSDAGKQTLFNADTADRGVVEVKSADADLEQLITSEQVGKYWRTHRLVLVTNLRQFALVGEDSDGAKAVLERYSLAANIEEFEKQLRHPQATANRHGVRLGEYLSRVMSHSVPIRDPRDLARLLALCARDALERVTAASDERSLDQISRALDQALGMRFDDQRGARLFRSTLVQTLFYGVFAAWVLWVREGNTGRFRWKDAVDYLQMPVLSVLFHQLTDRRRLKRLDLVEVLDWSDAVLSRVDHETFLARFEQGEAVQYFYEPFLEAFDPELRKQLGVWYTPREVVQYMVARVDRALRDDLGVAKGLADENVVVLDPCCGTGAFLVETLRYIAESLSGQGAAAGEMLRQAAQERIFGFEIMPAPLVVAHLQIGLALEHLDADLRENQRAGVFLTNALTGWDETVTQALDFPEFEEERKQADDVKRKRRILVVLGNPPYNGFAGVAVDEERDLVEAYRDVRGVDVPPPDGKGLHDLYVRFYRMAERRITERSREGVVCFISNYSWLDGLSYPGMREHYLDAFDVVRVDSLNGDKRRTGKRTPEGDPDPSVFSTEEDPVGIQVGTAIALLVRKSEHAGISEVGFRNLWGANKRAELVESAGSDPDDLYGALSPVAGLGLPFAPAIVSDDWFKWPSLVDLFPTYFPGVMTSRDALFVDHDSHALSARVNNYLVESRRTPPDDAEVVRYAYRPFDSRWVWWSAAKALLDRPRPEYKPHVFEGNLWIEARKRESQSEYARGTITRHLADNFGNGLSSFFPLYLRDDQFGESVSGVKRVANLSDRASRYVDQMSADPIDLFHHVVATLHDPTYRKANADALRLGWPRIPLPQDRAALIASAERGRTLARLLDTEADAADLLNDSIAVPTKTDGKQMQDADFELTAGWGRHGQNKAVMPGQGKLTEHSETVDIWLNDHTYWANIPKPVWQYRLGGYQVLKKWLSYREHKVLGRRLEVDEVSWFSEVARRIAAILEAVQ